MKLKIAGIPIGWLLGNKQPQVGDQLPDFTVKNAENEKVTNLDLGSNLVLISVVPSLKTKVCSLETAHFNHVASRFAGVKFITISNDPVALQKNWCAAHGIDNIEILSDSDGSFGKATHLHIPLFNHLARVVYLVDQNGKIIYYQLVEEVTKQPNYKPILTEIKKIINQ